MYLTTLYIQLLVDFVNMFRNFVNYKQKNKTLPFTHVIVSPLVLSVCLCL